MTLLAAPPAPSLLQLAALLSGLGPDPLSGLGTPLLAGVQREGVAGRTCIDGGSGVIFALRAPGLRALDVAVRDDGPMPDDSMPNEAVEQHWRCLHVRRGQPAHHSSRRIWPGRDGGPILGSDPSSTYLRGRARVWAIEYDASDMPTGSSWQVHRDQPIAHVLDRLGLGDAWRAAAAEFDAVHGFPVSATSGPWSIARRFDGTAWVRLGTTRWAWSVDDAAKRARLSDWIDRHGGDRAHASALHDLLTRSSPGVRVGRAVEIDLVGDRVVAVSAYLVAPTIHAHEGTRS